MSSLRLHIVAALALAGVFIGGMAQNNAAGLALAAICGTAVLGCVSVALGATSGTLIDRKDGQPLALSDLVYLLHKCGMETPAATPLYVWQDRQYVPLRGLFAARIRGQRALILDSTQEEPHALSN
jgi:hypothetical protein